MANERQISIRLPQEIIDRAEGLVEAITDESAYRYVPRVGLSFVLRLAMEQGLDSLEAEYLEDDE